MLWKICFLKFVNDCVPIDEHRDVCGSDMSNEDFSERSNNMKRACNDIVVVFFTIFFYVVV